MGYQPIETGFTRAFGLQAPIVGAPMALAGGGRLAAAVSRAGGLGFIGGGYGDGSWIETQFDEAGDVEVGCGFISWKLAEQPDLLDTVLARRPRAMFLSFGDLQPFADRVKAAGVPLFAQVQSVAMAREALAAGADVIVAQGAEAGGHGAQRATMTLVPEVVDMVAGRALVLAAGGIADGRGLAAALMLGAEGVVMGTRFWASREALVPEAMQQAALAADGDATLRSSLPDMARGLDWPAPWDIRTLRNAWIEQWQAASEGPVTATAQADYASAVARGDPDGAPAIVGEGIGLIRDLPGAGEILVRVMRQAREALTRW